MIRERMSSPARTMGVQWYITEVKGVSLRVFSHSVYESRTPPTRKRSTYCAVSELRPQLSL